MPGLIPVRGPAVDAEPEVRPAGAQQGLRVELGEEQGEILDLPRPQRVGGRLRGRRS